MKVVEKLSLPEWIKHLKFDVGIPSYDHSKLDLNSDKKRELGEPWDHILTIVQKFQEIYSKWELNSKCTSYKWGLSSDVILV